MEHHSSPSWIYFNIPHAWWPTFITLRFFCFFWKSLPCNQWFGKFGLKSYSNTHTHTHTSIISIFIINFTGADLWRACLCIPRIILLGNCHNTRRFNITNVKIRSVQWSSNGCPGSLHWPMGSAPNCTFICSGYRHDTIRYLGQYILPLETL